MYKSDEPGKRIHEVVEYTKTEAGNRYIYLPSSVNDLMMCIRFMNRDGEYMMSKNGERINKTAFYKIMMRACDACGIPRKSMHKIRRTYATALIDNNVDDSLIMSQMGHTTITTTRKYYYYANKNDKHKSLAL